MNPTHCPAAELRGWYAISLRPVGGHGGLRRAVARHGGRLLALSPLRLEACPQATVALEAALACPVVVFTSPAAVRFAAALRPLEPAEGAVWCAVGAGTVAALHRAGVARVQAPAARADSENLLALPALRTVRGVAVGLVTAPGGRGLLARRLRRRGARLRLAEVYRRVPVALAPARLAALAALEPPLAVLLSSAEAWNALWAQAPAAARARLRRATAIASSPRLGELARAQGLTRIRIAAGARPRELVAALREAAAAKPFR